MHIVYNNVGYFHGKCILNLIKNQDFPIINGDRWAKNVETTHQQTWFSMTLFYMSIPFNKFKSPKLFNLKVRNISKL